MLAQLLFYTILAFIFIHELDAIQQEEWRFFFAIMPFNNEAAYRIFTALHLPLFVLLMWFATSIPFQIGFDVFMLIHATLHWGLRNHQHINFNNTFSRIWIFGGAGSATLHLIILLLI